MEKDDSDKQLEEKTQGNSGRSSSEAIDISADEKVGFPSTSRSRPDGSISGVPASPPSFVTLEEILHTAESVSKSGFDMSVIHEIAVNKDFQLQKSVPTDGCRKVIREMLHEAFWDILDKELTAIPPDYEQAIALLTEVKAALEDLLLPYHTRLRSKINEVLDIALIKQQVEKGVLDVHGYADFVISIMSQLCAPVRDTNIQELKQHKEVVPLFRGILETLDLMKLDMANYTIQQYRPHIQQVSIDYEREKFQEILNSLNSLVPPVDGLEFTRQWLRDVYAKVLSVAQTQNPSHALVLQKAYVEILEWNSPELFPETLQLDQARFAALKDSLTAMILAASVLLVTYSTAGSAIQKVSELKEDLKNHVQIIMEDVAQCSLETLQAKLESVGNYIIKVIEEHLQKHSFPALSEELKTLVLLQIKDISSPTHSVRQLLRRRILEFIELVLSSPTSVKIPPGLSSLQTQLMTFAGQFLSLVKHNRLVFNEYYMNILADCSVR